MVPISKMVREIYAIPILYFVYTNFSPILSLLLYLYFFQNGDRTGCHAGRGRSHRFLYRCRTILSHVFRICCHRNGVRVNQCNDILFAKNCNRCAVCGRSMWLEKWKKKRFYSVSTYPDSVHGVVWVFLRSWDIWTPNCCLGFRCPIAQNFTLQYNVF